MNVKPTPHSGSKPYLTTLGIAGLLSWIAWTMVILQLDPEQSTATGLSLFYISLFFGMIALFTLLGFGLRAWKSHEPVTDRHLSVSLRQGILLSICTLMCVALLMFGVLRWWNGLLVVTLITLFELYVTSRS